MVIFMVSPRKLSDFTAAFFCSPIQGAPIHGTCSEYPLAGAFRTPLALGRRRDQRFAVSG